MFGSQASKPNPFGLSINTPSTPSLFGSSTTAQPQQQQPQQQQSLFGSTIGTQQQQQLNKPVSSLFGSTTQQPQNTSLFGQPAQSRPQATSLFGSTQQQQQQQQQQQPQPQQSNAFGGLGSSLFGMSQQPLPKLGSSGVLQPQLPPGPREKSVLDQMATISEKWRPDMQNTAFQYYFYNSVPPEAVPYYVPPPGEDEKKWEEALSKKPSEGSIPVLVKSFVEVGSRLEIQAHAVNQLQARLHEINDSLTAMMQKHDLEITVRAAEARRKHLVLSQRCLTLATKVQVLRNRGYALEGSEEELKKRLTQLATQALDPILSGRQEEIWARMSSVRARVNLLQEESGRLGNASGGGDETMNEETIKKVQKILGDYDSQLNHLLKEVASIRTDFDDWERNTKPTDSRILSR